jgi:chromate transporter
VIAKRSIVDLPTAAIAVATVLLLWRFRIPKKEID